MVRYNGVGEKSSHPHPQSLQIVRADADQIPVRSHFDPGGFPLAPDHDIEAFPAVQTAVVAVKVKANVIPIRCVVINQSSLFHDGLLSLWAAQREGLMQCTSIATASRF